MDGMESAVLTGIQRFSLNDGPGIRTTVFFQGCNMRCAWCHNPETYQAAPQPMLYLMKCIGCGPCFRVCPTGAQQITDGVHSIDRSKCTSCGACADACKFAAVEVS
jgi:pyruvate formate lyase activating enzyme